MSLNFANKCRCILSESQSKAPASKQTKMEGYTLWTTFNCFLSMMLLRVAPLLTSFQVTGHSHENIRALQARIPGTQTKSLEAISQKLDEMFAFILPLYEALTQGDVVFRSQFYKFLCHAKVKYVYKKPMVLVKLLRVLPVYKYIYNMPFALATLRACTCTISCLSQHCHPSPSSCVTFEFMAHRLLSMCFSSGLGECTFYVNNIDLKIYIYIYYAYNQTTYMNKWTSSLCVCVSCKLMSCKSYLLAV